MRVKKQMRRYFLTGVFFIIILLTTACSGDFSFTSSTIEQVNTYPVHTTFKEFYDTLGGIDMLGPAISPLETHEDLQCQFVERALMCFNPIATGVNRFQLYPLGLELHIQEDTHLSGATALPGARVVEGIVIYEKFLPLYDRLYGARYVGRPLTELRINQDLQRAEQFFENVGFFEDLNDPSGQVYLIPYGAYLCGGDCSSRLDEYWSLIKASMVEQPFATSVTRLGGPSAFGSLMLKPRITEDGFIEQVYANAVFYAPQNDLSQVKLRPLAMALGYEVQPLVEMKNHESLVFYEVQDGLGHNVPRPFDNFIAAHGGREVSGQPIAEVILISEKNVYRQCFENYCLDYDPAASDLMKVQMVALGLEYIERFPPPEDIRITNIFSPDYISLLVSSDKPNIGNGEYQYIRIMVRQKDTGQPIERVEAVLTLDVPNQSPERYVFLPTDANGMSILEIVPKADLQNGDRISYKVCLNLPSEQPICAFESYLFWDID